MAEIVVVGSLNLDVSVGVTSIPGPGETVLGSDARWSAGGKGANQAVAAARLGRDVAMIGCVGDDSAGHDLVAGLVAEGIDVAQITVVPGVATGLAMIAVEEPTGENSIVVSPGANARLTPGLVSASPMLANAMVVLLQLEVPVGAVAAAAVGAKGLVILNPAPARTDAAQLLTGVDIVVPNQHELATLAGAPPLANRDEMLAAAWGLDGDADVVVTLGSHGALVVPRRRGGPEVFVAGEKVEAVDTTAAGDSFCGGLADALSRGAELVDATKWASRAAALTVQKHGAQDSLPYLGQLDKS